VKSGIKSEGQTVHSLESNLVTLPYFVLTTWKLTMQKRVLELAQVTEEIRYFLHKMELKSKH
jgi:hypothetical protein